MDRVASELHETVRQRIRTQAQTRAVVHLMEQEYVRLDGSRVPVETTGLAIRYQDRDAHLVFVRDITDRKRADQALRDSEAKYRIVADNTYDWEFWTGLDGKFIYSSPSCLRVTGHAAKEFVRDDQLFLRIIHPDDLAPFQEHLRYFHARRIPGRIELRIVRPDGSAVWVEHVCGPARDGRGNDLGTRGSNRDITDRKNAETQILEYQTRLREMALRLVTAQDQERRRIADGLHDQIGQNIATLRMGLQVLRKARLSKANAQVVQESLDLLKEMGDVSRTLAFEICPPLLYEMGLGSALDWLIDHLRKQHSVRFHACGTHLPAPLPADLAAVLYQSVRELLSNAIRHANAGNITLCVSIRQRQLQIEVRDDGVGFDPAIFKSSPRPHWVTACSPSASD